MNGVRARAIRPANSRPTGEMWIDELSRNGERDARARCFLMKKQFMMSRLCRCAISNSPSETNKFVCAMGTSARDAHKLKQLYFKRWVQLFSFASLSAIVSALICLTNEKIDGCVSSTTACRPSYTHQTVHISLPLHFAPIVQIRCGRFSGRFRYRRQMSQRKKKNSFFLFLVNLCEEPVGEECVRNAISRRGCGERFRFRKGLESYR